MTNKKITDLASLASATSDDVLVIVDTATNTTRKITKGDFVSDVTSPPAGTDGQIQFNSSSAFGADSNLYWDNTNKRLGVGTSSPSYLLSLGGVGVSGQIAFNRSSTGSSVGEITGQAGGLLIRGGASYINMPNSNEVTIANSQLSLGARLGIRGSGSTSATTSLLVQNSSGTAAMTIKDDRSVTFNSDNVIFGPNGPTIDGSNCILWRAGFNTESIAFNLSRMNFTDSNGFVFNQSNYAASLTTSAVFDIQSTTKGFLPPRMTTTQKNAIASPAAGLQLYDSTTNRAAVYTSAWENVITETNGSPNSVYKLWSGSAAQYAALTPDSSTLYFVI